MHDYHIFRMLLPSAVLLHSLPDKSGEGDKLPLVHVIGWSLVANQSLSLHICLLLQ
jgi:hypothetical protein